MRIVGKHKDTKKLFLPLIEILNLIGQEKYNMQ